MASPTIKAEVDFTDEKTAKTLEKIIVSVGANQVKYAEIIRDEAKRRFYFHTHNTVYGRVTPLPQGSPASLAEHGLVVSKKANGEYTVGPKKGKAYGTTYDKIFAIHTQGRTYDKPVFFELPQHRKTASEDGTWHVKTIEAKPFIAETMVYAKSVAGQRVFVQLFSPDIEKITGEKSK